MVVAKRSKRERHLGTKIAGSLTALSVLPCITPPASLAQSSVFRNQQKVYGPLVCALESSYAKWLSGPLKGVAPASGAFTAGVNASGNPFTVSFAPAPGSSLPSATYSVESSSCVSDAWPAVPSSQMYPLGPATLSGSYALAIMAADRAHAQLQPSLSDAYAYVNSPGGGVDVATLKNANILVSFYQYFAQPGPIFKIGCYKEQQFLVNPTDFTATQTTIGCPG